MEASAARCVASSAARASVTSILNGILVRARKPRSDVSSTALCGREVVLQCRLDEAAAVHQPKGRMLEDVGHALHELEHGVCAPGQLRCLTLPNGTSSALGVFEKAACTPSARDPCMSTVCNEPCMLHTTPCTPCTQSMCTVDWRSMSHPALRQRTGSTGATLHKPASTLETLDRPEPKRSALAPRPSLDRVLRAISDECESRHLHCAHRDPLIHSHSCMFATRARL